MTHKEISIKKVIFLESLRIVHSFFCSQTAHDADMCERGGNAGTSAPVADVLPTPGVEDVSAVLRARQGLPAGWDAEWSDRHSRVYYVDKKAGKTQWDYPP